MAQGGAVYGPKDGAVAQGGAVNGPKDRAVAQGGAVNGPKDGILIVISEGPIIDIQIKSLFYVNCNHLQ